MSSGSFRTMFPPRLTRRGASRRLLTLGALAVLTAGAAEDALASISELQQHAECTVHPVTGRTPHATEPVELLCTHPDGHPSDDGASHEDGASHGSREDMPGHTHVRGPDHCSHAHGPAVVPASGLEFRREVTRHRVRTALEPSEHVTPPLRTPPRG